MARKRGTKNIPAPYSQGKDVFPIVPFRVQIEPTTAGTSEGQTVALDLDFEENEVLDIMLVETEIIPVNFTAGDGGQRICAALLEDPDLAVTTDVIAEAFFETNDSVVYYHEDHISALEVTAAGEMVVWPALRKNLKFAADLQPYTVARDLLWIVRFEEDAANVPFGQYKFNLTIWGRRRNASDAEFKNIIYRQRF